MLLSGVDQAFSSLDQKDVEMHRRDPRRLCPSALAGQTGQCWVNDPTLALVQRAAAMGRGSLLLNRDLFQDGAASIPESGSSAPSPKRIHWVAVLQVRALRGGHWSLGFASKQKPALLDHSCQS